MMIAKTPQTLIRLIKQGVSLCSVNVGNLSNGAHKFCVTDAIYISMEQLYYFEKIAESGVNLVIQKFPEDNVLDFIDLASEKALKNNMCAIQSL
jgi:mannose/fructose/N-acetylgalactosamine-specific phosphotransferase system component IIB